MTRIPTFLAKIRQRLMWSLGTAAKKSPLRSERASDRVAAMADKSGFRIRLRARIAKGLTTEDTV
jgi:hypothetical protein